MYEAVLHGDVIALIGERINYRVHKWREAGIEGGDDGAFEVQ